jgi:hypothetical protein
MCVPILYLCLSEVAGALSVLQPSDKCLVTTRGNKEWIHTEFFPWRCLSYANKYRHHSLSISRLRQFFLRHVSATNPAANAMRSRASSYYPDICLKRRRKPTKNLSEESRYSRRDTNRAPPEYKSRDLLLYQHTQSFVVESYRTID